MPVFIYPFEVGRLVLSEPPHRSLEELLAATETATHVLKSLERYEPRDRAIEVLEDDVRIARSLATEDVRVLLRPLARAAV
jgi:hypothetical protein